MDGVVTDVDRLREVSAPVEFDAKTRFLAKRLKAVVKSRRGAVGLAAPQIGTFKRVFVYDVARYPKQERGGIGSAGVVCNPTVVERSVHVAPMWEGCLSIPQFRVQVERPVSAVFEWFDERGEPYRAELAGMPCRVFLHEIDHLDGVLMTDLMVPGTEPVRR